MKTVIATTALVLGLAAPAFANSQLAADLGVDATDYTTAQLVELHFAQDENVSERNVYFGAESAATVSSKSTVNPAAAAVFQTIAYESEPQLTVDQSLDTATVYSSAVVNDRAAAIFADLDAE